MVLMSWLRVSSEETTLRKIYGVEGFRFLRFMNITSGTYQGEKLVMCLKPVVAAVHKGSMGNLTAKISLEKKTNLPVIIVLSTPLRSPFPISTLISLQTRTYANSEQNFDLKYAHYSSVKLTLLRLMIPLF